MAIETIDESTYQVLIASCVDAILHSGRSLDDVLTDPRGPASWAAGRCNLDTLAEAVVCTIEARIGCQYNAAWTDLRPS